MEWTPLQAGHPSSAWGKHGQHQNNECSSESCPHIICMSQEETDFGTPTLVPFLQLYHHNAQKGGNCTGNTKPQQVWQKV